MAEERGAAITGDRVEARLDKLSADVTELKVSVGRLETGFDQMDKRIGETNAVVGDVRREVRQLHYVVLGAWVTTMLAILSMSLTILSRLK
jgi:hypothetical protein